MADVLANGYGTVAGTRASPQTLLSVESLPAGANFVTITNTDATNWLFVRAATHALFAVALPGASATIACGAPMSDGVSKIQGFATTPSEGATITLTAAVSAYKVA